MTWREGYLRQAESDFAIFREFQGKKPICQQLHYLQMATEKLAKAWLCGPNNTPPPKVHQALVRFLRLAKGRIDLQKKLGYYNNVNAFKSFIDSLLPLAEKIENLAPVGKGFGKPNPEYPWKESSGEILCPLDYTFPNVYSHGSMKMVKMQDLIHRLIRVAKI